MLNQAAEPGLGLFKSPSAKSLCEEPVQPLLGSLRPILVSIQLQTSPSSLAPRHQGAPARPRGREMGWGGRSTRGAGGSRYPPSGGTFSQAASPHLLLSPCQSKQTHGSLEPPLAEDVGRKIIYSSKILLHLFPIKFLLQDSASPRRDLDLPAAEGGISGLSQQHESRARGSRVSPFRLNLQGMNL